MVPDASSLGIPFKYRLSVSPLSSLDFDPRQYPFGDNLSFNKSKEQPAQACTLVISTTHLAFVVVVVVVESMYPSSASHFCLK